MIRYMNKRNTTIAQNKLLTITLAVAIVCVSLGGLVGYKLAHDRYSPSKTPSQNTPGYITEKEARDQVNGFYAQYLNPKQGAPEDSRKAYIDSYGTKNLTFYSQYYQHGFDPIVCSPIMPTSVTATDVKPGPGATVTAAAKYPDGTTANIGLTLILNNEGFGIDTVTCPGDKGNLLPNS